MRNPRLGVIVPYRNRPYHLQPFLFRLKSYLSKTDINYKIIIVDQDDEKDFNRGMLCNIGFLEAKKLACKYVVFHDVDMIPIDVDYSYSDHPVHLISEDLPFDTYFGGMTMFPVKDFEKIDGFSNFYWGWGFEDDDLRYRCIKNNLKLNNKLQESTYANRDTVILNGENSFIKVKNPINHLRSFKIEIDLRTDKLLYDHTKTSDIYPIFSLKGYDFTLFYSSFKRFTLQFFDKEGQFYQIYSDPIDLIENNIIVEYNHLKKIMKLSIDNNIIGEVKLKDRLYEYNKLKDLFIGVDHKLENFFKGAIDNFNVLDGYGDYIIKLDSSKTQYYKIIDGSNNNTPGRIFKAELGKFSTPNTYTNYKPIRRKSVIEKLSHESSGFIGGRWKSDLTRWNQLRFNNEVINGRYEGIKDGLSTCEYILHSKTKDRNVTHLKVGI